MESGVKIIRCPREMQATADAIRLNGKRIGVVPTMGLLHDGHRSILRAARTRCDTLILTIFVNPTQFAPGEDLDRYPRDEDGDLKAALACGVDIAFCPDADAIYGKKFQTHVKVNGLSQPLCGVSRPEHFCGVTTIVTKLFNITKPHVALFGQKDYQQLVILRQMNRDLDFGIEIVGVPIYRESDGLAMSSRNAYLSEKERSEASRLYRGLMKAQEAAMGGKKDVASIVAMAREVIENGSDLRIDYLELRDADSLGEVTTLDRPCILATAVFAGETRLIDNVLIKPCDG